jgi:hypothetical protein
MNHANDPLAPPAAQIQMPEHFSSEPDLSHQWVTSMQPQWKGLVQIADQNIRNLQTVLFNVEADKQMRIRAHTQLTRNSAQGCPDSAAVLAQWHECGLTLA